MCVCASACSGTKRQDAASFFYYSVVKFVLFFLQKLSHAANVLGRSLTLLISVWDRGLTD